MLPARLAAPACLTVLAVAAAAVAPAQAGARAAKRTAKAPRVQVLVVGATHGSRVPVLWGPRTVRARAAVVRAGHRRCVVGAGTPLAALVAARRARGPAFHIVDKGSCSRRAVDAGSLFVTRIGIDRNRGRDGWVYRVGQRVGSTGAGDPSGPFGAGRLRNGDRVTWFYCHQTPAAACQRQLDVAVATRHLRPGASVPVIVRAFDDRGRGIPAVGATVALGASRAVTDANGRATLTAPAHRRRARLTAVLDGLVPAFPLAMTIR